MLLKKYHLLNLEHQDKLNNMIQELSTVLAGVKHEQEYMEIRDKVHRASKMNVSSLVLQHICAVLIFICWEETFGAFVPAENNTN